MNVETDISYLELRLLIPAYYLIPDYLFGGQVFLAIHLINRVSIAECYCIPGKRDIKIYTSQRKGDDINY